MILYTVAVESSEISADWIDTYYVAATSEGEAKRLAEARLRSERPEAQIKPEATEAYAYAGEAKVLAAFDTNEEED